MDAIVPNLLWQHLALHSSTNCFRHNFQLELFSKASNRHLQSPSTSTMKLSSLVSLSLLVCLAPSSSASTRPFKLINEEGEDLLESIANEHKMGAFPPGAPRLHTPKASASVQAPVFEPNDSKQEHELSPLYALTNNGELSLETVLSDAFDKIHQKKKITDTNHQPRLRGSQKSPFIPIDVDVMKRYNERNGKAF